MAFFIKGEPAVAVVVIGLRGGLNVAALLDHRAALGGTDFHDEIIRVTGDRDRSDRTSQSRGTADRENVIVRTGRPTDIRENNTRHRTGGIGQGDIPEIDARIIAVLLEVAGYSVVYASFSSQDDAGAIKPVRAAEASRFKGGIRMVHPDANDIAAVAAAAPERQQIVSGRRSQGECAAVQGGADSIAVNQNTVVPDVSRRHLK